MPSRPLARAAVLTVVLGLVSRVAAAQVQPPGPLSGPPDQVPPRTPAVSTRRLDLNVGLQQGYDRSSATDTRPIFSVLGLDPRLVQDSAYTTASTSLAFSNHTPDVDFGVLGGANARYYSVVSDLVPVDAFAGFGLSAPLTRRLRVRAGSSASVSPYYSFGDFLIPRTSTDVVVPPQSEQNIVRLYTISASAFGGLTWQTGRRTSIDAGYTFDSVQTTADVYSARSQGANVGLGHRMTKYATFRLGYGQRRSNYSLLQPQLVVHNIDIGLGYARPLSFSRRTSIGFNMGTSLIQSPTVHTFAVIGDASLTHQLTRRWATSVNYHRDVDAFAGLSQPYLNDVVAGTLAGPLARRVGFSVSGGYSRGRTVASVDNGYSATDIISRIQFFVSRYVPVYLEYAYYRSEFERPVGLAPGFPLLVNRNGLRAGFTYSAPIIGRRATR